jgi:YggT family protein
VARDVPAVERPRRGAAGQREPEAEEGIHAATVCGCERLCLARIGPACKPRLPPAPCGRGVRGLGSADCDGTRGNGIAMGSLVIILLYIINIVWFIVIAHVVMSWLIGFNVLNRHQPLVNAIWTGLNRLLEPIYGPIRRMMPDMGGLDLSPLVLIVILYALQTVLVRNAAVFF